MTPATRGTRRARGSYAHRLLTWRAGAIASAIVFQVSSRQPSSWKSFLPPARDTGEISSLREGQRTGRFAGLNATVMAKSVRRVDEMAKTGSLQTWYKMAPWPIGVDIFLKNRDQ